jgi:hypothetical protein
MIDVTGEIIEHTSSHELVDVLIDLNGMDFCGALLQCLEHIGATPCAQREEGA